MRTRDVLRALFPQKRLWQPTERWQASMEENLARAPRLRSPEESQHIKEAVWEWRDQPPNERPTLEELGRQFDPPVSKQYLSRLARTMPPRPTWPSASQRARGEPDAAPAPRTPKPEALPVLDAQQQAEPRVLTTEERIAETLREVAEWKRKNPPRCDTRRRISVPIPR